MNLHFMYLLPCAFFSLASASLSIAPTRSNMSEDATPSNVVFLINGGLNCLSPSAYPDWAGSTDVNDCERAIGLLRGRVYFYGDDKVFTFWSRRSTYTPPADGFEFTFRMGFQ